MTIFPSFPLNSFIDLFHPQAEIPFSQSQSALASLPEELLFAVTPHLNSPLALSCKKLYQLRCQWLAKEPSHLRTFLQHLLDTSSQDAIKKTLSLISQHYDTPIQLRVPISKIGHLSEIARCFSNLQTLSYVGAEIYCLSAFEFSLLKIAKLWPRMHAFLSTKILQDHLSLATVASLFPHLKRLEIIQDPQLNQISNDHLRPHYCTDFASLPLWDSLEKIKIVSRGFLLERNLFEDTFASCQKLKSLTLDSHGDIKKILENLQLPPQLEKLSLGSGIEAGGKLLTNIFTRCPHIVSLSVHDLSLDNLSYSTTLEKLSFTSDSHVPLGQICRSFPNLISLKVHTRTKANVEIDTLPHTSCLEQLRIHTFRLIGSVADLFVRCPSIRAFQLACTYYDKAGFDLSPHLEMLSLEIHGEPFPLLTKVFSKSSHLKIVHLAHLLPARRYAVKPSHSEEVPDQSYCERIAFKGHQISLFLLKSLCDREPATTLQSCFSIAEIEMPPQLEEVILENSWVLQELLPKKTSGDVYS